MIVRLPLYVEGRIGNHGIAGPLILFQKLRQTFYRAHSDALMAMAFSDACFFLNRQLGQREVGVAVRIQYRAAELVIHLGNFSSTTCVHAMDGGDAVEVNDAVTRTITG